MIKPVDFELSCSVVPQLGVFYLIVHFLLYGSSPPWIQWRTLDRQETPEVHEAQEAEGKRGAAKAEKGKTFSG